MLDQNGHSVDILQELIQTKALQKGDFTLTSGQASGLYFDMRPLALLHEGAKALGQHFAHIAASMGFTQVGGMESGAIPLVTATVMHDVNLQGFFVRKSERAHGRGKRIEGNFDPARPALILEDVASTGGSMLKAVEAVRAEGGVVAHAAVILDRQMGAEDMLKEAGVTLHALYKAEMFKG